MFKGKILIFVTLMCIYLLFAILIYPLISFKEQNDVYTTRMVEDFFANQISYLALENEVSSHYTNLNTDTLYASIYENPIYYKKSILEFFEKKSFSQEQLDIALAVSCKIPPKNQIDFLENLLEKLDVNKDNFKKTIERYIYDCVANGFAFMPTGSYYWSSELRARYKVLATKYPFLQPAIENFLSGASFTLHAKEKIGWHYS